MATELTSGTPLVATTLPDRLLGLTIDKVSGPDDNPDLTQDTIIEVLDKIKRETGRLPVVRIVFDVDDEGTDVVSPEYRYLIKRIKDNNLAYVMGEILDSSAVYSCLKGDAPEDCYVNRTAKYLEAFGEGNLIDLWEVGNEMNGEWVGWDGEEWKEYSFTAEDMQRARDTYARAVGKAHKMLTDAGKETALTFYFNDDGVRHSWSDALKKARPGSDEEVSFGQYYSMLTWANDYSKYFKDAKYVFISYYEDDQFADEPGTDRRTRIIPAPDKWAEIFMRLHEIYPDARLGFGEMGPQCYYLKSDRNCILHENDDDYEHLPKKEKCPHRRCNCCLEAQKEYVNRYYVDWDAAIRRELRNRTPDGLDRRYVGGYFYWHFSGDVIDKITASKDPHTPKAEKKRLLQEATATLDALIAAFR